MNAAPHRIKTIQAVKARGGTLVEAAKILGMKTQHVWRIAKRLGLTKLQPKSVPPRRGRCRVHTDEQILEALRTFYATHGRAPFVREQRGMRLGVPCKSQLIQRFGSIDRAYRLANVPRNPQGGRAIHGRYRDNEKPHIALSPINPEKAEAVTRAKRDYWQQVENGKHGLTGWQHPYARKAG